MAKKIKTASGLIDVDFRIKTISGLIQVALHGKAGGGIVGYGGGGASDPYMFSALRQGNVGKGPTVVTAGLQYQIAAITHYSPPYETRSPRFCYASIYADQNTTIEHNLGNDVLYEGVSIEIGGVRTPITVGGQTSFTVSDGQFVWTDENSIVIPANTVWRELVAIYIPVGLMRPQVMTLNNQLQDTGGLQDGWMVSATTRSSYLTGSGTITATSGVSVAAAALIVAKGWKAAGQPPVVLVTGDSIGGGANHSVYEPTPPYGVYGYIGMALADNTTTRLPFANMSVGGTTFSGMTATTFANRKAMLAAVGYPFTTILSEMGTNEGGGGAVAAWPNYGAFLKSMGNRKVVQATMLAKSSRSVTNIGWTTLGNQILSDFTAYNNWIRATTASDANLNGVIDNIGLVESANNSGLFKVPGFTTTLAADFVSGTTTVVLNAKPEINALLCMGAGTAQYRIFSIVKSIQDNVPSAGKYTCTLRQSTTAAGYVAGTQVDEVFTDDGVHPAARPHILAMASVLAAKTNGTIV